MSIDKQQFVALNIDALQQQATGEIQWLWNGYIPFRSITLLTSYWKAGKTTLLSVLLARMKEGGTVANAGVAQAPAIIVSEEGKDLWLARHQSLQYGPNVQWICQPFLHSPSYDEWEQLVAHLEELASPQPTLVVIDTLAGILPGNVENSATAVLNALAPLRRLTSAGAAVLLLHHPRKDRVLEPRGSGAISGFADVLLTLSGSTIGDCETRRRRIGVKGRYANMTADRLIEWSADGRDYILCDAIAEACADGWSTIRWVLVDARNKMTRDQIFDHWPEGHEKPPRSTLWEWLETAQKRGLIRRDGQGRKFKPFRYWLPEREQFFFPELPPLEPPGAEATLAVDLEFAQRVVERES